MFFIASSISAFDLKPITIGIHKDHHGKVFELFHRLNPDDSTNSQGLGLTITKRALDRNDGWIWIESEEGKGSNFFVSLPRA